MTDLATTLVPALAGMLFDFLWQGALIGLLAWLALALLRNARPQARYAVACIAMLACIAVPATQLLRTLGAPAPGGAHAATAPATQFFTFDAATAPAREAAGSLAGWPALPADALPWIVALWAAGAGLLALRMGLGLLWIRRLRPATAPAGTAAWQSRLDRMATAMGIRRKVLWRVLAEGDTPLAAGWWRPVVMVPAALVLHMPTPLLEALVAHELAHVRRHDYLVNLCQGVVEVLLFYHPVVWWLSRQVRLEREQVADDIAARLIGEPRRLAIALSELDRYVPVPTPALAAHGGHLMSRIQQLIRPRRRAPGSAVALPLVALAIAGVAIAHAATAPAPPATDPASPAPTSAPAAPAGRDAGPAGVAPPAPPAAPTPPSAAPRPPAPPAAVSHTRTSATTVTRSITTGTGAGYALVRRDHDGITLIGDSQDRDAVRRARQDIDGDFIWFERDGKDYVLTDPTTVAKARAAWQPLDTLDTRMQALDARMRPHSERMEALGARMDALSDTRDDRAMDETARRMQELGERQRALGERQAEMARRMASADEHQRDQAGRDMEALARQQADLARQMDVQQREMDAHASRLEAQAAPMEALGRQMEQAGKPMEAIGKDMEAVGKQIEAVAAEADAQVRQLIDEAVARGLASPSPVRR